MPLRFLRHGGGKESLEIVEGHPGSSASGEQLGAWQLQGTTNPEYARLLKVPSGYEFETTDAGLFRIDLERGQIEVPAMSDTVLREQRLYGPPMILSFLARDDISLHAAAVEIGDGAVILGAPSRFGKTTLALAFQRAGHRVLSEDLICCRPSTGEAIPGPALLRLRPDVFQPSLPEGLFVAAERPDRVFIGLAAEKAGSAAPVPIKGIVFLREGDEIGSEPADPIVAVKDLWRLNFRIGSREGRADSFRHITKLCSSAPLWNLTRPLTLNALGPTVDLVQRLVNA